MKFTTILLIGLPVFLTAMAAPQPSFVPWPKNEHPQSISTQGTALAARAELSSMISADPHLTPTLLSSVGTTTLVPRVAPNSELRTISIPTFTTRPAATMAGPVFHKPSNEIGPNSKDCKVNAQILKSWRQNGMRRFQIQFSDTTTQNAGKWCDYFPAGPDCGGVHVDFMCYEQLNTGDNTKEWLVLLSEVDGPLGRRIAHCYISEFVSNMETWSGCGTA